jgi:phosphatidylserine synthase
VPITVRSPGVAAKGDFGRTVSVVAFLLAVVFTVANLFCGYACKFVYSTRDSDFDTAALFIGFAMVLVPLTASSQRLTNSSSAFGVRNSTLSPTFVSFGLGPAILHSRGALWPLRTAGMGGRVSLCDGCALRIARLT